MKSPRFLYACLALLFGLLPAMGEGPHYIRLAEAKPVATNAPVQQVKRAAKDSATAIILVTHGDAPPFNADDTAAAMETVLVRETVTSHHLLGSVSRKLELAKVWGLSEERVYTKLHQAITVRADDAPGLFVIEARGLEPPWAAKVVNALCAYYAEHWVGMSTNGGPTQTTHVSIVRRAE